MEITRRGFLKFLVAAPIMAKAGLSLGGGLIKIATTPEIKTIEQKIITSPETVPVKASWHLAVIDKKTAKILFNDMINGDPERQAARITRHLQKKTDILTVYLTPVVGTTPQTRQATRGQKSYVVFNNMKFD